MKRIKTYESFVGLQNICDNYSKEDIENLLLELRDEEFDFEVVPVKLQIRDKQAFEGSFKEFMGIDTGKYYLIDYDGYKKYNAYFINLDINRGMNAQWLNTNNHHNLLKRDQEKPIIDNYIKQKKATLEADGIKLISNLEEYVFDYDKNGNRNTYRLIETNSFILW